MFESSVVVYGLKWHWNFSVVVELLKLLHCAYMPRRNTSQRPPEPPQDRTDNLRAGRCAPTSSVRREKKHYTLVEGEVGERDLLELMLLGDQRHRRVHPRQWTRQSLRSMRRIRCMSRHRIRRIIFRSLSLTSISLMRISNISMRIIMSSLVMSRSSLILRSLNSRMMVGFVFMGCQGWCTTPDRTAMLGAFWSQAFTSFWWTCGMQDMGWCRCKYILMFILLLLLFIQLILIIILLI